ARILAALGPVHPFRRRMFDERMRILGNPARRVRWKPPDDEGHLLAGGDREFGCRSQLTTVEPQRCAELETVRPGDRMPAVTDAVYPRDDRAVVEPHDELDGHVDLALEALDEPDEQRAGMPQRETVDDPDPPGRGLVLGLEHHRARSVTARRASGAVLRRDREPAVLGGPQQRGEARRRVE